MSTTDTLLFEPDYAIHPGETLAETLEELGMSQAELAQRIGRPRQMIGAIIHGKEGITGRALNLGRGFRGEGLLALCEVGGHLRGPSGGLGQFGLAPAVFL